MRLSIGKTSIAGLGIFVLLLAMYSIGTISAITVSWTFTLMLLILSVVLLAINYLSTGRKNVSGLMACWLILTIFCFFGVIQGGSITVFIFYLIGLIILALCGSIETETIYSSLKWLKWFGLFFSLGCYWQYFFPNQYYEKLYPMFGSDYQTSIRRQFTFHKMCTGFTSQTAVAAGFIVLGLMVVIYTFSLKRTRSQKVLSIIEIIFLTGGLLLTGKRSPILNLGVALLVVDMITIKRSKKGNRIVWIALGLIVVMTILYFIAPLFTDSRNSLARIFESINAEDATEVFNGRFSLYTSALSEFMQHPIMGIGWGKYSQKYDITGVHNIYLQLLCECGIFGLVFSVSGMLFVLFRSINMLRAANARSTTMPTILLKCSVFIQMYILVYGMFGNPLYDQNYILMYFLGVFISVSMSFRYRYLSTT